MSDTDFAARWRHARRMVAKRTHWSADEVRGILARSGLVLDPVTTVVSGITCGPDGITAAQIVEMYRVLATMQEDEGKPARRGAKP